MMRSKCSFKTVIQRFRRDVVGLPSSSPSSQSSEFLKCAVCNFVGSLGIWQSFLVGVRGTRWDEYACGGGMRATSHFRQNAGWDFEDV